jgi:hypothetical protein
MAHRVGYMSEVHRAQHMTHTYEILATGMKMLAGRIMFFFLLPKKDD